jgi:hypothetical protein
VGKRNISEIYLAMKVLGLSIKSSKEEIIARTKALKSSYEESEKTEDFVRLAEIYRSSQILLESLDEATSSVIDSSKEIGNDVYLQPEKVCESELGNLETIRESSATGSSSNMPVISLKSIRKKLLIGILVGFSLLILSLFAVPAGISFAQQNKYQRVETMMMDFNSSNMYTIGKYIDDLPYDYRNIQEIKTMYQIFMSEVQVIEEGNKHDDYEEMRTSFYDLVSLDDIAYQWDLSGYLDDVDKEVLLLGIYWTSNSYHFSFRPKESEANKYFFSTNLPNDKELESSYTFYWEESDEYDTLIFGYTNSNDSSDSFDAFRVISISQDEIVVYCYFNGEIYSLLS